MKSFILSLFLLFSAFDLNASNLFAVTNSELNLRKGPSTNEETLTVIKKGDTVKIENIQNGWAQVYYYDTKGYVSIKYLKLIDTKKPQKSSQQNKENNNEYGFVVGFKNAFSKSFIVILFLLGMYKTYQLRVKDGRFKEGFRNTKMSDFTLIKLAAISLAISAVIGFGFGIVSMINGWLS